MGDVHQVLRALLPLLQKTDRSPWLARIEELKAQYPLSYVREGDLKPQYIIERLSALTEGNAIVATDVGQHQMWVAQYYRFKKAGNLVSSGGLGCMGFGLPAALGACMGRPGEQVVLVTGDGSIQMTMQELGTMVEQKLPLKILLLNNKSLGLVRQLQEFYCEGRYMAVNFDFHPDFSLLAKAYGIPGYTLKTEDDVDRLLPEALALPGPVLIECLVPVVEKRLADGSGRARASAKRSNARKRTDFPQEHHRLLL